MFYLGLNVLRHRLWTTECETVQKLTVWVVYVGVWKGKNCLHILVFCQNCQFKTEEVREEAWKEGEVEWEDAGGERWRQMRIGAQKLKWPRWPDADKLPLLSTLSALPLICHCHPAALHLFPLLFLFVFLRLFLFCEPLLLIHDYIFMLGSIIRLFKSFYPFFKIPVKRYLLTFGSVFQMHCLTFNVSQQACSACGKWLSSSHYFDWLRQAVGRSRGLSLNEYLLSFLRVVAMCQPILSSVFI